MSEFVNYQKRGIELPPGCKDLIDVLRLPSSTEGSTPAMSWQRSVPVDVQAVGRLSNVPAYVSMVVNSPSEQFLLMIGTTDKRLSVMLCRRESTGVLALILVGSVRSNAEREKGIREFFQRHGIGPLKEPLPGEAGVESFRGFEYPLPAGASQASQLTIELLSGVFGITEASQIQFRYYDIA